MAYLFGLDQSAGTWGLIQTFNNAEAGSLFGWDVAALGDGEQFNTLIGAAGPEPTMALPTFSTYREFAD